MFCDFDECATCIYRTGFEYKCSECCHQYDNQYEKGDPPVIEEEDD